MAMPRSEGAKGFRLAHVALEDTLISGAISRSVHGLARSFLGPEPLLSARLDESDGQTGCLLDLLPEGKAGKIRPEHVLEFDAPPEWNRKKAGLWILHTIDGSGWPGFLSDPDARSEHLRPIQEAFHRLCRITGVLAAQFPAGVLAPDDPGPAAQAAIGDSSRLGGYKLRRDVLCRFFNLLSRVLAAREGDPEADQLRYILQAVLRLPDPLTGINDDDGDRLAQEVVEITVVLRGLLAKSLGKNFLALSSCAVLGASLRLDVPQSQLPAADMLECPDGSEHAIQHPGLGRHRSVAARIAAPPCQERQPGGNLCRVQAVHRRAATAASGLQAGCPRVHAAVRPEGW